MPSTQEKKEKRLTISLKLDVLCLREAGERDRLRRLGDMLLSRVPGEELLIPGEALLAPPGDILLLNAAVSSSLYLHREMYDSIIICDAFTVLREKVPNVLSCCHTKSRMGARGHAHPSFGVTPTF